MLYLLSGAVSIRNRSTNQIAGNALFESEIILITFSTAIRTKNNKNFRPQIFAIFHTYCYYNFNPCGIFENMISFTPILNHEMPFYG